MTDYEWLFDTGTNGSTVSVSSYGGGSTAPSAVTSGVTFSSAHPYSGGMGILCSATGATSYFRYAMSATAVASQQWVYLPSVTSGVENQHLGQITGASATIKPIITSAGTLRFVGVSGTVLWTSTVTVPVGSLIRVETFVDTSAGTARVKVFDSTGTAISGLDSGTITNSSGIGTGTMTNTYFGKVGTSGADGVYIDSAKIRTGATDIIGANVAPTANAGADQSVAAGTVVTLVGSGSDTDGTIASYTWSQVSGPATLTLSSTTVASPTFTPTTVGVYVLQLAVTDNGGSTGTDTVQITVTAANVAPSCSAGADITVEAGQSYILTGTDSDSDGTISARAWILSGSTVSTSTTVVATAPATLSGVTRTYTYQVTDNGGLVGTDTVTVTVLPASRRIKIDGVMVAVFSRTIS